LWFVENVSLKNPLYFDLRKVKKHLPTIQGIVVMLVIAVAASFFSTYLPSLGSITIALLLAMGIGYFFSFQAQTEKVFKYAEKNLLAWATILLGFGLNLSSMRSLPPFYIAIIFAAVVATLLFSRIFKKYIGDRLGWLLGAGNGICGNAAIGATAPILKANVTEIGLAVAIVNLLGTIGIFIFPPLVSFFGLSSQEGALFSGAVLQSVGHVVAAAYTIDPAAAALALLVKMGRILLLGPVIILIGLSMKHSGPKPAIHQLIPYYVWGFLVASLITSSQLLPTAMTDIIEKAGSYLLLLAMIGIGLGINLRQLLKLGPTALFSGSGIFFLQIVFVLGLIFLSRLI